MGNVRKDWRGALVALDNPHTSGQPLMVIVAWEYETFQYALEYKQEGLEAVDLVETEGARLRSQPDSHP